MVSEWLTNVRTSAAITVDTLAGDLPAGLAGHVYLALDVGRSPGTSRLAAVHP